MVAILKFKNRDISIMLWPIAAKFATITHVDILHPMGH